MLLVFLLGNPVFTCLSQQSVTGLCKGSASLGFPSFVPCAGKAKKGPRTEALELKATASVYVCMIHTGLGNRGDEEHPP